jgi:hypothetical protein
MELYAIYNTDTNTFFSNNLTSDMIDYLMYSKNLIKNDYLKVIKNASNDQLEFTVDYDLVFKAPYKPIFVGINY